MKENSKADHNYHNLNHIVQIWSANHANVTLCDNVTCGDACNTCFGALHVIIESLLKYILLQKSYPFRSSVHPEDLPVQKFYPSRNSVLPEELSLQKVCSSRRAWVLFWRTTHMFLESWSEDERSTNVSCDLLHYTKGHSCTLSYLLTLYRW